MAARVVIVGQGYVGLPLAVAAASAGHAVIGLDVADERVAQLNAGISHVSDVAEAELREVIAAGRYRASSDTAEVAGADVVVICVPTPYHNDAPDLSHIQAAGSSIGAHLKPGTVVILESTTYPGTTEELLQPILEEASGLTAGTDFHLVFSPERIDPGNERFGLRNTPKIVGGLTREGSDAAAGFYATFVDEVVRVSKPAAAEMAKLLENTFRHINIALVNELAILCQDLDVDVWEVIDAAASKPFGFMPFYPGPGVGGHCIPVDPMYLSWRVKQFGGAAKFIELARDVNEAMPAYCVTRVQDLLNDRERPLKGSKILLLGVAYKQDISDMRESPALAMIEVLLERGSVVEYHDPHVESISVGGRVFESVEIDDERLRDAACVVVLTAHSTIDYAHVAATAPLVFDTRHCVPDAPSVERL
jgi:UDP-N-acetyl-D-glucosamine dehydrogenase